MRQDILDELADHLTSSYHRELLRGSNSTDARARALERFGDPATVARRLWLDAMKGKIMAQRVLIGTCVLLTAASLSLVGLFWQQAIQARREAAAQRDVAHAREQEVLKQLQVMSEAIKNPRSLDWNPLKFKLTEATTDGPPVAGVDFILQKVDSGNGGGIYGRTMRSDASGIADFGLVNPGEYTFALLQRAAHIGDISRQASVSVNVQPGSDTFKHIVCPKFPPEQASVKVKCSWPADLEKEGLVLFVSFGYGSRRFSDLDWTLGVAHALMSGPATAEFEFLRGRRPHLWRTPGQRQVAADVFEPDLRALDDSADGIQWELGHYRLTSLIVLRPAKDTSVKPAWRRYQVIAGCNEPGPYFNLQPRSLFPGNDGYFWIDTEPPKREKPDAKVQRRGGGGDSRPQGINVKRLPDGASGQVSDASWGTTYHQTLEIRPGKVNEWTVSLPEELITAVRDQLKSQKTSETQQ